jgi:hypothetical protein
MRHARVLALGLAGVTAVAITIPALAAAGGSSAVTVPTADKTVTYTWKGTIPPGSDPSSDCTVTAPATADQHTIAIAVPAGRYDTTASQATFSISWTPTAGDENTADEIITVLDPKGQEIGSGDTSSTTEQVSTVNPAAGTYTVQACGFVNAAPQAYVGKLTITSKAMQRQQRWAAGGITATRETVADPFRLGTEPTTEISPADGTVYESQIFGFSTTQSFLQRSVDGGSTFQTLSAVPGVGKLDQCTGGGDSALATDHYSGDLWMIDLGGAPEVPARVSHDHGTTWTSNSEANYHAGANYFTDRQWLSRDDRHQRMLYIYRDGVTQAPVGKVGSVDVTRQSYGEYIKAAPLPTKAGTAGAPQITFGTLCTQAGLATPCVTDVEIAGPPATDNTASSPHYGTTYLPIETAGGLRLVVIGAGSKPDSVSESSVLKDQHQVLFPWVTVDRAGTAYLVWTDAKTFQVRYAFTSDAGRHWSAPVTVNGAPAAVTVMPTAIAGDSGRLDIAFYGSPKSDNPTTNYGPWYVYLAQTLNATSAHPTFAQAQMSDRPNHIDPVCLSGLGCTLSTGPAGDRELGDFFTVTADKAGRAMISFADGDNQLGNEVVNGPAAAPSFAHFVRQATGPSLYVSVGQVPALPTPTNGVRASGHHTTVPALQVLDSSTAYDGKGNLVVRLHVRNADPSGVPAATGMPVATYLTRFVQHDGVYAVAAEWDGGQWRYFAGPAQPVTDGLAIKYAYYPATSSVTGSVDPKTGTITVTVPLSAVGSPKQGAPLYSVTSYALVHLLPTLPTPPGASYTDFPQIADVLPSYNVEPARR